MHRDCVWRWIPVSQELRIMRVRFAISLILVALVSILSVVGFAQISTAREINTYMFRGGMAGVNALVNNLEAYYGLNGTWNGVAALFLDRITNPNQRPGMMGQSGPAGGNGMMGQHLLMAQESGIILIDTDNQRTGQSLTAAERNAAIQLNDGQGNRIGYLFITGGMQFQPGAERDLILKLNSAARMAALLASGVAIILAMFLGYLILRPVKRLTLAANQIAGGDLSQRVPVKGKDELATLGNAFNTMAESLENAQENRKAMTADIAHELRTPLAIQRAILEAIQDGVYPLDHEQMQHVYEQNQSLTRLVDDLRTLALADAGELKLEKVDTDICKLVERTIDRFQSQATQKGIHLKLEKCGDVQTVYADIDPFRIEQVLNNLISNALRYSPAGSTVTGMVDEQGSDIAITIRDQGDGIPKEEMEHIFERFYRGDRSRSRSEGGTGLGLAIARQLARAHNGDLTVRNHPEGGAEFILRLPVLHR